MNCFLHTLISGQAREVDLKLAMGQNSEKLYIADERCGDAEKERDELKRRYFNRRIDNSIFFL